MIQLTRPFHAIFTLFFVSTHFLLAQESPWEKYKETVQDAYLPLLNPQTSSPYQFTNVTVTTRQVNVDAAGMNILGDAANEPSMAVDPTNPLRLAIGWRQFDHVASNFRKGGFAYSNDGGLTWTGKSALKDATFRSDPVLASDANGRFYYNSLEVAGSDYYCYVHRTDTNDKWDTTGVYAYGGDKQWMDVDKSGGVGNGNIYANWNQNYSVCPGGNFTRSIDGGDNYEACSLLDNIYWGNIHVATDGTVFAPSFSGLVAISHDAKYDSQTPTWSFGNTQMVDNPHNGNSPNPAGLLGTLWLDSEKTNGSPVKKVFLGGCFASPITGNTQFYFSRSTDGGFTWSTPNQINDDQDSELSWHWLGAMSVAPNGRIDAAWLDTRDNLGEVISALYYAYSWDDGTTWSVNEKISDTFDPHIGWPNQQKMGDYFHMYSDNQGASLAWCGTLNGEQDVYYSRIINQSVATHAPVHFEQKMVITPNPFKSHTRIHLGQNSGGDLSIYNHIGQEVYRSNLVAGQKSFDWEGRDLQGAEVASGVYFVELRLEKGEKQVGKLVRYE